MAYGFQCAHCGRHEADHISWVDGDDSKKRLPGHIPGYKLSLMQCAESHGFTYRKEDEDLAIQEYVMDPKPNFQLASDDRVDEARKKEGIDPIFFWKG